MAKLLAGESVDNKKSDDIHKPNEKSPSDKQSKNNTKPQTSGKSTEANSDGGDTSSSNKGSGGVADFVNKSLKAGAVSHAHNVATEKTGIDTRAAKTAVKFATKSAPTLAKLGVVAKIIDLFSKMQLMMLNMLSSAATAVSGFLASILAIGGAIVKGVSVVAGFISSIFTGAGIVTAALVIGGPVVGGGIVAVSIFSSIDSSSNLIDDKLIDCEDTVKDVISDAEGLKNPSENTLKNARLCYSIFKGYGLSNVQIAGILGNWDTESGIDFTTVEGIYSEPHTYGERTKAAIEDTNGYCINTLFPNYAGRVKINKYAYKGSDGKYYPGIGIAQFTGPAAETLLNMASKFENKNWYDVDYQLAFAMSAYRKGYFNKMKDSPETTTIEGSTRHFLRDYEGSKILYAYSRRLANAKSWLKSMEESPEEWVADTPESKSALDMISDMGDVAIEGAVGIVKSNCVKTIEADNSSLATAALSIAWDTEAQSFGNNGNETFKGVCNNIFPHSSPMQSCDITVATAIRWSGSDIDFPKGHTGTQADYLAKSEKWQYIGDAKDLTYEQLRPGDLFNTPKDEENGIYNGHTFIFVGKDLVKEKRPELQTNADSVSGSYFTRSPALTTEATYVMGNGGFDYIGDGKKYIPRYYKVYRLIKPDNSNKYSNLGK